MRVRVRAHVATHVGRRAKEDFVAMSTPAFTFLTTFSTTFLTTFFTTFFTTFEKFLNKLKKWLFQKFQKGASGKESHMLTFILNFVEKIIFTRDKFCFLASR